MIKSSVAPVPHPSRLSLSSQSSSDLAALVDHGDLLAVSPSWFAEQSERRASSVPPSRGGRRVALVDLTWPRDAAGPAGREKPPLNHQAFSESLLRGGVGGAGAVACVQGIIETLAQREAQSESGSLSLVALNVKVEDDFKSLNHWRNGLVVDFNRKVEALENAFLHETASSEVRAEQRDALVQVRTQLVALCAVIDSLGRQVFLSESGQSAERQRIPAQFQQSASMLHTVLLREHEVRQNHRFTGVTVSREAFPYNRSQLPRSRMERVAIANLGSCEKPSLLRHGLNRVSDVLRWFNQRCVPSNPILKLVFWSLVTVCFSVMVAGVAYGILHAVAPLTAAALVASLAQFSATTLASIKIGTVVSMLSPLLMALWTYIKGRLFPEPGSQPTEHNHSAGHRCTH